MDANTRISVKVERCVVGHQWVTGRTGRDADPEQFLIETPFIERVSPPTYEAYDPLAKESALFKLFAALDPTPDSIVRFANEFGRLTSVQYRCYFDHGGQHLTALGDPYHQWIYHMVSLNFWVRMWELAVDGNSKELVRLIDSLPHEPRAYSDWGDEVRAARWTESQWLLDCKPSEQIAAAFQIVGQAIDSEFSRVDDMGDGIKLGMQRDSETGGYRFTASARDLRSAIYLQFATAVAEEKQFRNCETCGRPFELTPDVARTNRLFCKPYCRIKAYRRRQRAAKRMHQNKRSLKHIAVALNTDVPTVRGWVK
jgi:hypothetical protein